jgi:hypothetical protein
MVSFSTHVSEAHVTIGLMTVLYNFNFERLVTNLLLKNFCLWMYIILKTGCGGSIILLNESG